MTPVFCSEKRVGPIPLSSRGYSLHEGPEVVAEVGNEISLTIRRGNLGVTGGRGRERKSESP